MQPTLRHASLGIPLAIVLCLAGCSESMEPPAPSLDGVPALTNENPIRIEGAAEPNALVQVRGGTNIAETNADATGAFALDVELQADQENVLLASQVLDGVESMAAMARITHDGTAPAAPSVDAPASPTRLTMQTVQGSAEAGAAVEIEGGAEPASGEADADGRFAIEVMLTSSASSAVSNDLEVFAIDAAGNRSDAATAAIVFDPNLTVEAPSVDDVPAFTNEGTLTLSGTSEPGVGVTVVGGATEGSAVAAADGSFSLDVGLRPNALNTLLAFAVSGTDTSPSVTLRIEHDDILPDAAVLDAQASPTGATVVRLTGASEPLALLEVSGGAAAVEGAADDAGIFSLDVTLTEDASNALSVIVVDRAGNRSEAAELTIVQNSSLEAPINVDPVTSPTASPTVTLSGTTVADTMVEIAGGAALISTTSDSAGAWMAEVTLLANTRNELRISRPASGVETLVTIEHDDTAPAAPTLNALASPTNETRIDVTGLTDPFARVSVTGATATAAGNAASDGRFRVAVTIAEDTTTELSVIATDRAGNASAPALATVVHSSSAPAAPSLDETNPAPTNMASYVVTGQVASPGMDIEAVVRGAMAEVVGDTDPTSGAFSVTVMLNANDVNMLEVVSREGAIESSAALVTVIHDDIAPAAPNADLLSASAGTCVAGIPSSGNVAGAAASVEGRARVEIENVTQSSSATTTATDLGSFNVSLASCAGDVIRVHAVDAATNRSDPSEINAE